MNILQLCLRVPFPAVDGGAIAMEALADGLIERGHKVKVLAFNTAKHFVDLDKIDKGIKQRYQIEAAFVENEINAGGAFLNLFSSQSYHISRFYSKEFEDLLIRTLNTSSFDVIILESIYTALYLPLLRSLFKGKIILRSHNVEHEIWEYIRKHSSNPLKKAYLRLMIDRLKRFELSVLNNTDATICISEIDKIAFRKLGVQKPMLAAPLGLKLEDYPLEVIERKGLHFFHIGSMDWLPNIEGIAWFIEKVWPDFYNEFPDCSLLLAGRHMPDWLKNLNKPGIKIIGEVKDSKVFISQNDIKLVPLFSGSGIRVKILEAMALGKLVISTGIGKQGLEVSADTNILLAETREEMLRQMRKCYLQRDECKRIAANGRRLIETKYCNVAIAQYIDDFLTHL